MKSILKPTNLLYFFLYSIIINSFILIRQFPLLLLIIIPLYLFLNIFVGTLKLNTENKRIIICHHGGILLLIFAFSLIPSIVTHTVIAIYTIPNNYMLFIYSLIYCIVSSAIIFWIGIICVYLTSIQMGIKYRIIGALCGLIPILNLIILRNTINIVMDEIDFELEKEQINKNESYKTMCKTKYPLLLVHGVFFRDFKYFNYWGRIPRTLEARGAKIYYGEHQSALSVKDSGRELAERIKSIVEKTGCEKVNIIAHSKGGLDCRYALSEYGIEQYVASLTTINTPHRGCIFADKLLDAAPEKLKNNVAKIYNTTLRKLGDQNPDFMAAVNDLTNSSCIKLNEIMINPKNIYAQSFGSIMNKPQSGKFPLNLSYRYVKNYDGPNDGLVGEESFKWTENYTLLKSNDKRGISHGDIIDLNRENIKDFDVREFYANLVSDLKDKGL